jgi:hypothetical protein
VKYALALLLFAACGSHLDTDTGGGVDANGSSDPCAGCTTGVCTPTLGCVACDPAQSVNACDGNNVVTCNADGTFGSMVSTCGDGQMCQAGTCSNVCTADGVDLVYVVDEMNDFLSFDPRKLPGDPFVKIGVLSCPHNGTSIQQNNTVAMPFSMSVDRDGVAWILYTTGELFKVSLQDASCTKANNTIGAGGMSLFGMGFALDAMGSDTEKLFLAGGNTSASATPRKLGYDDTHGGNMTPTVVGNIAAASDYSPELTGTAEAKLYGFFPRITAIPYVQEIDKSNGAAVGMTWNVGTTGLGSGIQDWAFAQWGGVFYVFVTTQANNVRNSRVIAVDRASGNSSVVLQNLPYYIDGAGVSTCAPAVLQ